MINPIFDSLDQVHGLWSSANARDLHRLLHNELFFNVATKDFQEGEVRGQMTALPYNGLLARHEGEWATSMYTQ